jgi:hypothetical protein
MDLTEEQTEVFDGVLDGLKRGRRTPAALRRKEKS